MSEDVETPAGPEDGIIIDRVHPSARELVRLIDGARKAAATDHEELVNIILVLDGNLQPGNLCNLQVIKALARVTHTRQDDFLAAMKVKPAVMEARKRLIALTQDDGFYFEAVAPMLPKPGQEHEAEQIPWYYPEHMRANGLPVPPDLPHDPSRLRRAAALAAAAMAYCGVAPGHDPEASDPAPHTWKG